MSATVKVVLLSLSLILISSWSALGRFAAHNGHTPSRSSTVQSRVPQDLSGSYDGTVYFRDRRNKKYVITGPARLLIQGERYTLTKLQNDPVTKVARLTGKPLTGKITTAIIPEKENLGVGEIGPENEPSIEIRWHRDTDRDILKIIRAKGANRLFRFCSAKREPDYCVIKKSEPKAVLEEKKVEP